MTAPRREVAQEFWANIIGLGEMARAQYIAECHRGERDMNFTELRELDKNLDIVRAMQEQVK